MAQLLVVTPNRDVWLRRLLDCSARFVGGIVSAAEFRTQRELAGAAVSEAMLYFSTFVLLLFFVEVCSVVCAI